MADKTVSVNLQASVSQYIAQMATASKATSAFRGSLMSVGAGMTKFITLPVLAAGAGALKVAMDWESAFAGVRKTVEATEPQLAKLEAGLRDLATQLPATHEEIAGVAEAAGQLGIALPRIETFTKTMVDMGETTNLSADEAATAMARLANIMQMPQTQFERLGSTIVDLGNKGAATDRFDGG
jgi:TP901 family phage tail tape measure protein